jgi:hypothetical protein
VTLLFHSCRILFGADRKSYFPFPSRSVSLPPAEAIFPAADFRKGNKKELAGVCEAEENAAAQLVNVAKEMSGRQCRWEKRPHEKLLLSIFAVSVYGHAGGGQQTLFHLHTISLVFTTLYEVLMCLSNRSRQKVSVSMSAPMCWCRLLLLSLISKQTTNI